MGGTTLQAETAERFSRDTAQHVMTVMHDDGLYRHLRCHAPDSSRYWFDIVTWPGSLAIRGDMDGGYIFSRTHDMFTFFRNRDGIHPSYWAEKLPGGARSVRKYSEDVLKENLEPFLADYAKDYSNRVAGYENDDRLCFPEDARELLAELEGFGVVSDTWEWDLSDWDWPYLWACHAIVWGIGQYDAIRKPAEAVSV